MVELTINTGEDILDNLWRNLINSGARTRRHDSSRTGLLFSAIATEINVAISLLQSYASQYSFDTMTDRVLIEKMSNQYVSRRLASKSKVVLTFYRMEGFTDGVRIPRGFAVRSSVAGHIIFKTASTVTLDKGVQTTSVIAYSLNSGSENNVDANTLTIFANDNYYGLIGVTNLEPSFGGYNDESIYNMKERAQSFRYAQEYTENHIQSNLYNAGLSGNYLLKEYIDGPGTYMICIDTDSDYIFNDIKTRINYRHAKGIMPIYERATRLYLDMYITVEIAHDVDYTYQEKNLIYNNINDAIKRFFTQYCVIGADISLNALTAAINNSLTGYDISNINIDIANTINVNGKNIVEIGDTTIAYPNKIITSLEYVGENNG